MRRLLHLLPLLIFAGAAAYLLANTGNLGWLW